MTAKRNWRRSIGERGLTPYVAEEAVQQDPLEEDFGAAGGHEKIYGCRAAKKDKNHNQSSWSPVSQR